MNISLENNAQSTFHKLVIEEGIHILTFQNNTTDNQVFEKDIHLLFSFIFV